MRRGIASSPRSTAGGGATERAAAAAARDQAQAIKERERFYRHFGVYPPDPGGKYDMWPGYTGVMLRRPRERDFSAQLWPLGRV